MGTGKEKLKKVMEGEDPKMWRACILELCDASLSFISMFSLLMVLLALAVQIFYCLGNSWSFGGTGFSVFLYVAGALCTRMPFLVVRWVSLWHACLLVDAELVL